MSTTDNYWTHLARITHRRDDLRRLDDTRQRLPDVAHRSDVPGVTCAKRVASCRLKVRSCFTDTVRDEHRIKFNEINAAVTPIHARPSPEPNVEGMITKTMGDSKEHKLHAATSMEKFDFRRWGSLKPD